MSTGAEQVAAGVAAGVLGIDRVKSAEKQKMVHRRTGIATLMM